MMRFRIALTLPSIPGVEYLGAVRALEETGFKDVR